MVDLAKLDEQAVEAFRAWYKNHTGRVLTRSNAAKAIRSYLHALKPEGQIETRNEMAGFVEFMDYGDVPVIVRDLDGPAAVLVDIDTRKIVGYRVYAPAPVELVEEGQTAADAFIEAALEAARAETAESRATAAEGRVALLEEALVDIEAMETGFANATCRRMAARARLAKGGQA